MELQPFFRICVPSLKEIRLIPTIMPVSRWDVFKVDSISSCSHICIQNVASLAEIQSYRITYLIKHYHAQQHSGELTSVEV